MVTPDSVHGDGSYICDQCGYKATLKGNLKTHIDSVYGLMQYSCDQCDYKATLKGNLKRHLDYVHGGIGGLRYLQDTKRF